MAILKKLPLPIMGEINFSNKYTLAVGTCSKCGGELRIINGEPSCKYFGHRKWATERKKIMKACESCGANKFWGVMMGDNWFFGQFNEEGILIVERRDPNNEQVICHCAKCGRSVKGEISWDYNE